MTSPLIILSLLALLPFTSFAGGNSGGGGNAVVCFKGTKDEKKKALKLIDSAVKPKKGKDGKIKEGKSVGQFDHSLLPLVESIKINELVEIEAMKDTDRAPLKFLNPKPNQSIDAYMDLLERRFQKFAPDLTNILRSGRREFSKLNTLFLDKTLPHVEDYTLLVSYDKSSCRVITVARQVSGTPDILEIDSPLYDLMEKISPLSAKMLFVHEYVLLASRNRHIEGSNRARFVTRMYVVDDKRISPNAVDGLLKKLGFVGYHDSQILPVVLNPIAADLAKFMYSVTVGVQKNLNEMLKNQFHPMYKTYSESFENYCDELKSIVTCTQINEYYTRTVWKDIERVQSNTAALSKAFLALAKRTKTLPSTSGLSTWTSEQFRVQATALEQFSTQVSQVELQLKSVPAQTWAANAPNAFLSLMNLGIWNEEERVEGLEWLQAAKPRIMEQIQARYVVIPKEGIGQAILNSEIIDFQGWLISFRSMSGYGWYGSSANQPEPKDLFTENQRVGIKLSADNMIALPKKLVDDVLNKSIQLDGRLSSIPATP